MIWSQDYQAFRFKGLVDGEKNLIFHELQLL